MAFNFSFVGSSFFLYSWCCFCMVSYFSKLCLVTNHTEVLCHSHSRLLHCWIGEQLVPSLPSYVYNIFLILFICNVNNIKLKHSHYALSTDAYSCTCTWMWLPNFSLHHTCIFIYNYTKSYHVLYLYKFFFTFLLYRIG